MKAEASVEVQKVTIAVLGAPAVGKSTFVRCALDLKKASTSLLSSKKVSLEGKISVVRLLELGFDDVGITAERTMRWPQAVGNQDMPDIDGVLALYDVMDQSSIAPMPDLLSEFSQILSASNTRALAQAVGKMLYRKMLRVLNE